MYVINSRSSLPTFHFLCLPNSGVTTSQSSSGTPGLAATFAVETSSGAGFTPPAPGFNLRRGSSCTQLEVPLSLKEYCTGKRASSRCQNNRETRWGLEVQRKYDDFLERERKFITEGLLDQLPSRSRLFVGQYCHYSVVGRGFVL